MPMPQSQGFLGRAWRSCMDREVGVSRSLKEYLCCGFLAPGGFRAGASKHSAPATTRSAFSLAGQHHQNVGSLSLPLPLVFGSAQSRIAPNRPASDGGSASQRKVRSPMVVPLSRPRLRTTSASSLDSCRWCREYWLAAFHQ